MVELACLSFFEIINNPPIDKIAITKIILHDTKLTSLNLAKILGIIKPPSNIFNLLGGTKWHKNNHTNVWQN